MEARQELLRHQLSVQTVQDTIGTNLALGMGVGFVDEMNDVAEDMQAAVPTTLDGPQVDMGGVVAGTRAATELP
jgi:hypothetical protein